MSSPISPPKDLEILNLASVRLKGCSGEIFTFRKDEGESSLKHDRVLYSNFVPESHRSEEEPPLEMVGCESLQRKIRIFTHKTMREIKQPNC